jgi:hypothetical protein
MEQVEKANHEQLLYYLDDLKLDGIPWLQRSVAFAHDVGVMNENVWTVFLSYKSVALYVAERLDFAVHWTCFLGGFRCADGDYRTSIPALVIRFYGLDQCCPKKVRAARCNCLIERE